MTESQESQISRLFRSRLAQIAGHLALVPIGIGREVRSRGCVAISQLLNVRNLRRCLKSRLFGAWGQDRVWSPAIQTRRLSADRLLPPGYQSLSQIGIGASIHSMEGVWKSS